MLDAMTSEISRRIQTRDTAAGDRAAIRFALAMTAAVLVSTFAAAIGLNAAFPFGPDQPPPLADNPMPLP